MKKNNQSEGAPAEAEAVLARADQYVDALRDTHHAIPQALAEEMQLSAEWGSAAITGGDVGQLHAQLATTRERREAAMRRRHAAVEGLLTLEAELGQARAALDQIRAGLVAAVVSEFLSRWNQASRELAKLHGEAQQLSAALHVRVDCPPPYMATLGVVSGQPEVRLSLPLVPQPVALPPDLATVANALDRLDAVLAIIGGITQARMLDSRHYAQQRGGPSEHGVFRVVAEFTCSVDGLPFAPGDLIDHSLIGPGSLQRLTAGRRYVQPATLETAA